MLQFDSTDESDRILPPELFKFMRERYWVCVFRDRDAGIGDWCMATKEPMPVPNPQMFWRRPTWGECFDVAMIPIRDLMDGTPYDTNLRRDIHELGKIRNRKYAVEWKMKHNVFSGQDYPIAI